MLIQFNVCGFFFTLTRRPPKCSPSFMGVFQESLRNPELIDLEQAFGDVVLAWVVKTCVPPLSRPDPSEITVSIHVSANRGSFENLTPFCARETTLRPPPIFDLLRLDLKRSCQAVCKNVGAGPLLPRTAPCF